MSQRLLIGIISLALIVVAGCQTSDDSQQADQTEPIAVEASPQETSSTGASEEVTQDESEEVKEEPGTDDGCKELDEERFSLLETEADLNGNGLKDRAMEDREACGPSSCLAAILEACESGGYRIVAQIGYFQIIEALDETTHGWHDLKVQKTGRNDDGLHETSYDTYAWDGETYVRDE